MWGKSSGAVVLSDRIYLNVPFVEKDKAKALGARWDSVERKWYYTDPADKKKFAAWEIKEAMKLADLTDEQQELIERAKRGENVLVDACIGSGKTTTIQVLCNEMCDKKILYLTYNTLLKIDAREKITQSNVTVTNYHGFAYMCLKNAGISAGTSDLIQVFNAHKPALGRRYDMVVIDEYQDIEQEIADMLEYIKEKLPNIQIIAVGDMQQKIYDKTTLNVVDFVRDYLVEYTTLNFTKCFRLSAEHAKRLGNIWGKTIEGVNPDCKVSTMGVFDVVRLLAEEDPSDILCLGSRTGDMSRVLNILERSYSDKFNKKTVYASITDEDRSSTHPTSQTAIFTTFDSSKGMERKICVVFDYTDEYWLTRAFQPFAKYEILRNIFCVAASRGKQHIIFVRGKADLLKDEDLATPVEKEGENMRPFDVVEAFSFKYKEDIEKCYKALEIKDITEEGSGTIDASNNDFLIDISPCIGVWQEAAFFHDYDIDAQIEYAIAMHPNRPVPYMKKDATLDDKIQYLVAFETSYDRYMTQVKPPFISDEHKAQIRERLATVFDGHEDVQGHGTFYFESDGGTLFEIDGRYDVRKDDTIYELKFKSELAHEDFLQLAMYLIMNEDCEKGVLWNVKTNQKYEVRINGKRKFLNAVVKCATKGLVTRYHPANVT